MLTDVRKHKIFVCNEEGVGLQQNSWLMPSPPWWTCLIHLFFSLHLFSQNRRAPFWDKSGLGDMPASLLLLLTCENCLASSRVKRFLLTAGDGLSHRRLTQELQVRHQEGAHLLERPAPPQQAGLSYGAAPHRLLEISYLQIFPHLGR